MNDTNKVSDDVIEKIRKCLALAHGKGATQHEMEAAMGKAKEIAMRYHLELASIAMADPKAPKSNSVTVDKGTVKIRSKHFRPYHKYVCSTLSVIFGIRIITVYRSYVFIGEAFDVAVCVELFPWLEESYWGCYWSIRKSRGETDYEAATANGAYSGFYNGLLAANKRAEQTLSKPEAQSWALIVVNKDALVEQRVAQEFPHLIKARKSSMRVFDYDAYQTGYAKGRSVNLRQVGGAASSSSIIG